MRGEWCFFPGKFSPESCDEIIAMGLERADSPGTVGGETRRPPTVAREIRQSSVTWLPRHDARLNGLFSVLDDFVWEANNTWFGVDYDYHGTNALQFTIYRGKAAEAASGDYYHAHSDTAWISEYPAQRKLSVVVQLSDPDDYDGGDFTMEHVSQQIPSEQIKQRGTVLVFPSLIRHGVAPVTRGTRYSLVGWYMGPAWR